MRRRGSTGVDNLINIETQAAITPLRQNCGTRRTYENSPEYEDTHAIHCEPQGRSVQRLVGVWVVSCKLFEAVSSASQDHHVRESTAAYLPVEEPREDERNGRGTSGTDEGQH